MFKKAMAKITLSGLAVMLAAVGLTACGDGETSTDSEYRSDAGSVSIILDGDKIECNSSSVQIDSTTATIISGGEYVISGSLSDGMIIVNVGKSDEVRLVLDNASVNNSKNAAIYVREAGETVLTLKDGSSNYLSCDTYTSIDDNNIDGCIFSKSDFIVNGTGSLDINAKEGHAIVSKDSLDVENGIITVTCAGDAISGKDSLTVTNGTITINAGDDGLHSDGTAIVSGGKITIEQCCEGLEGSLVSVTGGEIKINASDDGINAAGEDGEHSVTISGGEIRIKASGDGIDSNGSLLISGGSVYVSGPENGGNGALDYDSTGQITGGTLIAVGNSQMAMNMDNSSTQGSILITTDKTYASGTEIKVSDSEGNILISYSAESSFNSVVASAPGMEKGGTYTISVDGNDTTVTLEDIIYGNGSGMGFGGMGHGGGMRPDGNGTKPDWSGVKPDGEGMMPGDMPTGEDGRPEGMMPGDMPTGEDGRPDGMMPGGGKGAGGKGSDVNNQTTEAEESL